ncbi:MAC/perforin domain-containing protein [Pseudomonas entomophila]|uniref:Vps62-related protein n=1 Tax=Pseudomonas entomophila TaxID=312306 RepID=UPI0023D82E48|nr:Vps62-related protein [Pseudomonas entomophila]MDF0729545.1 MAC/perforin domain-containing protein [Pseudomonas entomophila]
MLNTTLAIHYLATPGTDEPLLPGSDVMGLGYNLQGEFARAESTIGQGLFDLPDTDYKTLNIEGKIYRYNKLFGVSAVFRSDFHQVKGQTIDIYRESLGLSVGVSGRYKLFSASLETAFSSESLSHEETYYDTVREVHRLWQINLPHAEQLRAYLKPEARSAIENNDVSPNDLFDRFGAYYIGEAVIGGRLDYNAATKTLRIEDKYNISVTAKASYQALVGEISVDSKSELGKQIENFRQLSETNLKTVGGKPGLASKIFHDDDKHSAFNEWAASLLDYAVFMDFTSESLVPIWSLATDAKRRDALEAAFPSWIESKTQPVPKDKKVLAVNLFPAMRRVGTDAGSGAKQDLSVWAPSTDQGNRYTGQFAQRNHSSAADGRSALLRDLYELGFLKAPMDFVQVWTDAGSGKSGYYACWRPVPPAGYRALGDIMVLGTSDYSIPEDIKKGLVCVHESLCRDINLKDISSQAIWNDAGSGARQDVTLWKVVPENGDLTVQVGNFVGVGHYDNITQADIDRMKGVIGVLLANYTVKLGADQ